LNCLYCGKELGLLATIRRDRDFCLPSHREKYRARLMKGMQLAKGPETPVPDACGPQGLSSPVDALQPVSTAPQTGYVASVQFAPLQLSLDAEGLFDAAMIVELEDHAPVAAEEVTAGKASVLAGSKPMLAGERRRDMAALELVTCAPPAKRDRLLELSERLEMLRNGLRSAGHGARKCAAA
jgi:hypothetical protein